MKKRDLLIIIITLAIDQLSKYIASTSFMPSITIIDDFFWLTYAKIPAWRGPCFPMRHGY